MTDLNFLLNTYFSLASSLKNLFTFDVDCQSCKNRHTLDFWFLRGGQSSDAPECVIYYYINTWSWRISRLTRRRGINADETAKWKWLCGLWWISNFYPLRKFFLVFSMPSELSVSWQCQQNEFCHGSRWKQAVLQSSFHLSFRRSEVFRISFTQWFLSPNKFI